MCALKFYKRPLDFSMSAENLNTRYCKIYKRVPNFHVRAAKFYKRAPKFYLWKKNLFGREEKKYIRGENFLYIFLFPLYKL